MDRAHVIKIARKAGWIQCGNWRRYGPDWYQCFRRGRQFIWIGFDAVRSQPRDVISGFHRTSLEYGQAPEDLVKSWLGKNLVSGLIPAIKPAVSKWSRRRAKVNS